MNFKQLKDFDFKNIDIDRNQFERITVGVIILCALSLFLVTIKTQHSIKIDGTKITYKGQMQNHRLNGQGTLTYDNGDTYTGELRMVPLMVKEPSNLMRVGFIKVSSSLGKPMAKEN